MKLVLIAAAAAGALSLLACSFQAQSCCDCMATKEIGFGMDCLNDSPEVCYEQLSQSPPEVDTVNALCRGEENGFCQESCADILYRN